MCIQWNLLLGKWIQDCSTNLLQASEEHAVTKPKFPNSLVCYIKNHKDKIQHIKITTSLFHALQKISCVLEILGFCTYKFNY